MAAKTNILATNRRDRILDMIREDGNVKVIDLSRIFRVSEVTIRQDLEKLEIEGYIEREHGGAYLKNLGNQVKSFSLQHRENMEMKAKIGKKAAEYIHDGDCIILDSGTTTTEIARNLLHYQNLTVITNALNIALLLGAEPGINVIVTGGEFKAPTLSLTGEKGADSLKGLHADKLFLATAGISLKAGLTYPSLSDLVVKKAMIDSSDVVYLVADSSKIGKSSLASLGALSLVDYLITDEGIKEKDKQVFKEHEIEFIIAE
ncbi:MAG: DeoR/GlpR transcriptional regulator [Bacteroidales bacterium]|nr:DeoR/GlpR transcriptional regulator [Bacteroidales bacterium]